MTDTVASLPAHHAHDVSPAAHGMEPAPALPELQYARNSTSKRGLPRGQLWQCAPAMPILAPAGMPFAGPQAFQVPADAKQSPTSAARRGQAAPGGRRRLPHPLLLAGTGWQLRHWAEPVHKHHAEPVHRFHGCFGCRSMRSRLACVSMHTAYTYWSCRVIYCCTHRDK